MEISCEDCGNRYETNRKNTKYCRVCRVFRDAVYNASNTKKCVSCEEKFAPINRGDMLCGRCNFARKIEGTCALCEKKKEDMVHESIAVCWPCATDPVKRPVLIRALAKKRRATMGE